MNKDTFHFQKDQVVKKVVREKKKLTQTLQKDEVMKDVVSVLVANEIQDNAMTLVQLNLHLQFEWHKHLGKDLDLLKGLSKINKAAKLAALMIIVSRYLERNDDQGFEEEEAGDAEGQEDLGTNMDVD